MEDTIRNRVSGGYISITNTESIYHATKIPFHSQYINNPAFSCCNGIGTVVAGICDFFIGVKGPGRFKNRLNA